MLGVFCFISSNWLFLQEPFYLRAGEIAVFSGGAFALEVTYYVYWLFSCVSYLFLQEYIVSPQT